MGVTCATTSVPRVAHALADFVDLGLNVDDLHNDLDGRA